jgi:hypothetical protein
VHVTHPIDVDSNNKEQMMELYGYYAFLVDLHIAQVRPENLNEKSYVPARFTQRTVMNDANYRSLNNKYFEYYHRWREPTHQYLTQT